MTSADHSSPVSRWRALLRDQRGAAYAEAVIVLPVLILILWGNYLILGAGNAKMQAMNEARRAAWAASNTPDTCESDDNIRGGDRFDSDGVTTRVFSFLEQAAALPVVGGLVTDFFGIPYSPPTVNVDYDKPGAFGGGTDTATANYTIMCNTRRQTLSQMLRRAFCDLIESVAGGIPPFLGGMCS